MKKWRNGICALLLLALIPLVLHAAGALPPDARDEVAEKYAGFSGVLRVWVCEGWTDGAAFAGWLNESFARFEREHEGVYVEAIYVDEAALGDLSGSGVRPPDAILFAPGMAVDAGALAPLGEAPVREALRACGGGYAVPVALGGYAWAAVGETPVDRRALAAAAPDDEPYRCWSAATLALCALEPGEAEIEDPGIDLGLPASAAAEGEGGSAEPVTQREIARLERLREQGRGEDWRIEGAAAFTDQALMMSVVANGGERQALAEALALRLLEPDCQTALSSRGMFGVTGEPSGYAANSPYLPIDQALRGDGLIVAPAFSNAWRVRAADALEAYASGEGDAGALLRGLFGISEE